MFASVSNVLPLHLRQELPTSEPAVAPKPTPAAVSAAETPRPAAAPELPAAVDDDREKNRKDERDGHERAPSEEDKEALRRLKARDAEVRRHEQAHAAAGGPHATAPAFEYERGPDGRSYAVSGHVDIDLSEVPGDPRATLQKMLQVRRAALAPADPSGQDQKVAAEGSAKAARAQVEIQQQRAASGQAPDKLAEATPAQQDPADQTQVLSLPSEDGRTAATADEATDSSYRAQAAESAYRVFSGGSPEVPRLKLLACKACGGVHAE